MPEREIRVRHRTNPATRKTRADEKTRPPGVARLHVAKVYDESQEDPHILALKDFKETQQLVDPFANIQAGPATETFQLLPVPYNTASLVKLPIENNMLAQCIAAMVTNVEGHGYRLEFTGDEAEEGDDSAETSAPALTEKVKIENLLDHPNDDHTLQELRERLRCDLETMGNAYIEIGRDRKMEEIVMLAHLPAHTMRLTNKEKEAIPVKVDLPRNGQLERVTIRKRYRRFVQAVANQKVYFKEFGDLRTIDPRTGQVDDNLGEEESATEVIHISLYTSSSPYGIPRWINQLPAVMGSRQAELTNLDFFKENAIPAMALLVGGGAVTQASIDDTESHFLAARGRASMNRILVIEAEGDGDAAGNDGRVPPPKLELKPLQGERQQDALFQEYDKNNMMKIRSSFRIPPIFVGQSEDYTHATALTSYEVAESQVFGPERNRIDDMVNQKILATLKVQFWAFRTNPPRLASPQMVIEAIVSLDQTGALTPNVTIGMANELFDMSIPSIEGFWGNLPMKVVEAMLNNGTLTLDEDGNLVLTEEEPEEDEVDPIDPDDGEAVVVDDTPTGKPDDEDNPSPDERLGKVVNLIRVAKTAERRDRGAE